MPSLTLTPTVGFVPASSLIFVVIVAIWAAVLLQLWSRRREDAAATRSVDDFTEAMRVLEKRSVLPGPDLSEPRPRSWSVTPARVVRTTVDVKRAVPAAVSRRRSPLVARRPSDLEAPAPAQPEPARLQSQPTRHPRTDHEVEPMSAARPASHVQRRVRAAVLLVSLLWIPVSVTLAVLGVLNWLPVPVAILTFVAVLVWLRSEARVEQAEHARAASRQERRRRRTAPEPVLSSDMTQVIREPHRYAVEPAATPAESVAAQSAAARAVVAAAAVTVSEVVAEPAAMGSAVAAEAGSAAYDVVFDVQASEPAAPVATEPPAPGTWSPVPVPTPTYAMKAKAEPRFTADGVPADVFDTPEFADEADELDDRALFARRAVSQ